MLLIYDKDYWNHKYKKKPVIYGCRTMRTQNIPIEIDVKNFITSNDEILKKYIEKYNLKKDTFNETALACQKFIVEHFKYAGDDVNAGIPEYWQFPFETLVNGQTTGCDCEDMSILLTSLMINCGIPNYRVKSAAGYVQQSPTAPTCGHCYTIYLADREEDNQEWVILDTCYYEDTELKCEEKPLLKDGGYNKCYGQIWFTFNNEYSWGNEENDIRVEGRLKDN